MKTMGEEKPGEKELADIALVSYLACKGHKIKKIKRGKGKSLFVFDDTESLEADIMAYLNREATVDPLKFHETMRNLKSQAKPIGEAFKTTKT